jgi:hypothetical protein
VVRGSGAARRRAGRHPSLTPAARRRVKVPR